MNTNTSSNTAPTRTVQQDTIGEQQKNVLVPIDFSEESVGALRAAVSAAGRANARLTLLNVVEGGTIYRGTEVPGSRRKIQESHGRRLEHLADTEVPGSLAMDLIVGDGEPGSEINRIAAQRHVDCIVVGEHHHRHWFGGDTARKVADSAPCPVIVLKGEDVAGNVPARIQF